MRKAKKKPVRKAARVFRGDDRSDLFGVEQGGALIYDPIFTYTEAVKLAQQENSANPPATWAEARHALGIPAAGKRRGKRG